MTENLLWETVNQLAFRDWTFRIGPMGDGWFLQVLFDAPDSETGAAAVQGGRKLYVSPFAIEDEVVKTAWLAVELALIHEAREQFTFMGERIFDGHTDVRALVEIQQQGRRVKRTHPELTCPKAPPGWVCTRGREHEGPCAAHPTEGSNSVF